MTTKNKNWKMILINFEERLTEVFGKKLPELPEKFKRIIVNYIPYLMVILLILWIPIVLALVGIIITVTSFSIFTGTNGIYIISIICGLIMMVLQLKAIFGLFKKQIKSWRLLFYISLVNVIYCLLRQDFGGLIIGTGLFWYFLFQIKNQYK